ncbi:MAG: PUA domain-containing protein [Infirmifilum sp.]|uniref:PUA domain-containing protein n=1 Tax=Infirmifilum TaxID=2856573 RepID=UPI002351F82B
MKDSRSLKIVTRYKLNKKDKKSLVEEAATSIGEEFAKKIEEAEQVEIAKIKSEDVEEVYLVNGIISAIRFSGIGLIPSLFYLYKMGLRVNFPSVYVDSGAVPHILNGADVMIPGIKKIEGSFGAGERVLVRELGGSRVIAIGLSLVSSDDIAGKQKGKGIRNLHYLGDEIWKMSS